jgi:hypothetical protein
MCEYSCAKAREVIITDFINGFVTNNIRLISVPNKIPDLLNENAFLYGMCPVSVKKTIGIKQVTKYIDHNHQDI